MEIALSILSCLMILSVIISMIHKSYWVFRVLEYPRLQKLVIIIPVTIAWLNYYPFKNPFYTLCFAGLCMSMIYLIYKISPYTFLNRKEMKTVRAATGELISIFAANVYQHNRQYKKILSQIKETNPDIIFLLETDHGWAEAMQELKETHPYQLAEPLENTYGLLFFSRLKMIKGEVTHLVKQDIPSIDAIMELSSGQKLQLYGLHPEPPVPGENLYSTAKDKELMLVALKVKESKLPCIVFGDLNDVAWSRTTTLFRKTSELLDPRRGRGFYSTFSAKSWIIRFPLDYIFCSDSFGLVRMKRMPKNGSDHFAVFTQLAFQPELKHEHDEPKADAAEIKMAHQAAAQPASEVAG
jgi:endonuclease/exonuclease/phosphatase (EEP) superfamily protein YafD